MSSDICSRKDQNFTASTSVEELHHWVGIEPSIKHMLVIPLNPCSECVSAVLRRRVVEGLRPRWGRRGASSPVSGQAGHFDSGIVLCEASPWPPRGRAILLEGRWSAGSRLMERLWRQEGLLGPKTGLRFARIGTGEDGVLSRRAAAKDEFWGLDFVSPETKTPAAFAVHPRGNCHTSGFMQDRTTKAPPPRAHCGGGVNSHMCLSQKSELLPGSGAGI